MVLGAAKYLKDLEEYGRIHLGESLQKDADDLLYKSDSVHNFVVDQIQPAKGCDLVKQYLYVPYTDYCKNNGYVTVSRDRFFSAMDKEMDRNFGARCIHHAGTNLSNRGYRNFRLAE